MCGTPNWDKSTFVPPASGSVYYRVAFYDANTVRLYLSPWISMGSAYPGRTMIKWFSYNDRRVRRALVLWWENDWLWRQWAAC
jgi:hypothetical protein